MNHPGEEYAARMEAWWGEHGGNAESKQWHQFLDRWVHYQHEKVAEAREPHDREGRFGMSKAGGCTRAAVLEHQGYDKSGKSGSDQVTFWIGHTLEPLVLATLEMLGVEVDAAQAGVAIDPFMRSATDGIVVLDGVRTSLSVKSAGYKMSGYNYKTREWRRYGFAQYAMDGVKKTNPGYWAQMQGEMYGLGLTQSLFVVVAKDIIKAMAGDEYQKSLTFYTEIVPADPAWVESSLVPVWAESWGYANSGDGAGPAMVFTGDEWVELDITDRAKDGPNKKMTGRFNYCLYCDLAETCPLVESITIAKVKAV